MGRVDCKTRNSERRAFAVDYAVIGTSLRKGNHYGKMLLEYARMEAGRLGFKVVYLTTGEIGYYEKYGFREVGLTTFTWGRPTKVYEHDAIFKMEV